MNGQTIVVKSYWASKSLSAHSFTQFTALPQHPVVCSASILPLLGSDDPPLASLACPSYHSGLTNHHLLRIVIYGRRQPEIESHLPIALVPDWTGHIT